jgi:hypothetical protein
VNVNEDLSAAVVPKAVVLVEGISDRFALEVLARRRGQHLEAEGVRVVAMNGATNIGHYLDRYGPHGLGVRLAGLYDIGEEDYFLRGLERVGIGTALTRDDLEAHGFFVCSEDLEDELIRALGADEVERIVEAQGELKSFRILQRQPALRDQSLTDQLRRLMSGRSGGKLRYARLMANAIDLDRLPHPLGALLDWI